MAPGVGLRRSVACHQTTHRG